MIEGSRELSHRILMHGYIPPQRFFPYLQWPQIRDLPDKANTLIIQPVGAIEQHGPHLPIIVDTVIATSIIGKALHQLDDAIAAYALPPLYYGKSNEHSQFPGTIALSAQTLTAVLMETAESIYHAGFRKLLLVNGHGGQPQILEIVARDLRVQHDDLMIFPLFVWGVPHRVAEIVGQTEYDEGIHAGDIETSVLLALLPEQVKMAAAVREFPKAFPPGSLLSLEGNLPMAWTMKDLSRSGVVGDATAATSEKGEAILNSVSAGWVKVFEEIYRFEGLSLQD
ncbi:creatininase subfamily [Synechococcus sp. PCC 7335]|uniref:creatininase family protein n=1 Tax=Synechococcus sp. (strain ATCC 29403 / PCC 7335) TaxID=91464 RepID=UPI00017EE463|nr:creatininase family protein [Synechococcus sp. PCC 7335]EDX83897.1 creatininase subfamily [Synechococcus sp. PCC 7335]